jgi:pimeloyl-ACP methyl ester carboxylesterase
MRSARCTRLRVALLAIVVLVTLVAGSLAVAREALAGSLTWTHCGGGFECSTLTVPLADTAPTPTVDLAVVRAPARRPDARIGTLVFNPGGPGVPAVAYLRDAVASLPGALRDRFDLVAFDPRGVGASRPVECTDSLDPFFDQTFQPANEQQRAALVDAATILARQCAARNGDFLAHISTTDAVHDLERLRLALGEDQLSFVGYSYGTFLGASYANTHPDRVRAVVLDGPVDATAPARESTLAQARGFEHALDDFLADCSADADCAFHHDGHAAGAYDALRRRAGRAPLATSTDGRTLNQTRFDAAVLQQLYLGRNSWPGLAEALADAEGGDASTLLAGADTFTGRGSRDHALEAFWAISCLDGPVVGDVDAARALEQEAIELAPRLGAFVVNNSLPCSVWPVRPVPPSERLTAAGAPTILVVGTREDPATPLAQARAVTRQFARARLLVAGGEQHTSFANGNRCVDAAVTRYLVERRIPAARSRC